MEYYIEKYRTVLELIEEICFFFVRNYDSGKFEFRFRCTVRITNYIHNHRRDSYLFFDIDENGTFFIDTIIKIQNYHN